MHAASVELRVSLDTRPPTAHIARAIAAAPRTIHPGRAPNHVLVNPSLAITSALPSYRSILALPPQACSLNPASQRLLLSNAFGKESSRVQGADVGELKTAVDLMLSEVYLPHPHARLSRPLKALHTLPSKPHLYSTTPNLSSLLQKIDATIAQYPAKSFAEKADLQVARKTIASNWIPWLEANRDGGINRPPRKSLVDDTSSLSKHFAGSLPVESIFPILDLFRLSVLHKTFVTAVFRQPAVQDRKDINGMTRLLSLVSDLAYKGEWSASQRPLLLTAARCTRRRW